MLSGVIPARRRFASSPGKLPKDGPSFSPKPVSTRIRSRPVSTTNMLFVTWITGCMKFALNTGASSASETFMGEDRPDRYLPIAIRDHGCLEVADLEAIEAIAV